jgi:hypothetical protein
MFGLPFETALVVFGFPVFWIIYTAVFLYRSRDWKDDAGDDPR